MNKNAIDYRIERIHDIDEQIKKLVDEREEIKRAMSYDELAAMTDKFIGKWITIHGTDVSDEGNLAGNDYRLCKIESVESFEGKRSFRFAVSSLVYFVKKDANPHYRYISATIGSKSDNSMLVADIANIKCIGAKRAAKIIASTRRQIDTGLSAIEHRITKDIK